MAEKKTEKKKETKPKSEPVPVTHTEAELWKKLNELMVPIPKDGNLREIYTKYLKNKLRKTNANIHRFQYMKKNCDAQLKKRFELEKELGIKSKRLYSFTEERMTEEDGVEFRDVYTAFITSSAPSKVRKKDFRKFLTPKDVDGYTYVK